MKKLKKFFIISMVIILLISSVPVANAGTGGKSRNDAVNWAFSQNGKSLDYDGVYGAQCVDLTKYYYKFLGVSPVTGNGCDYAKNSLPSGWQRIQYYAGFVPQPGDVAVWTYTTSKYGHVAIVTSADASTMNVVEQNGSTHVTRTHSYNYSYGTFYGVIRPDFPDVVVPTITYSSIPEGEYKLQNAAGKYLGVEAGGNKNGNVHAVNGDDSAEQNFRIKNTEIGKQYYIKNLANASQYCVNTYTPTNTLTSQSDVRLWDENTSNSKYWGFEDAGGGYYYIRCMMNPQFVLTADGYNYPENVTVLPFDGRDTQKWKLIDNSIKKPTWASIHASCTEMYVGESIYFEFNSDFADSYTIGIDRNNERILTQGFGSEKSFTYTCEQPGNYSAYISASNSAGGLDSNRVYWTVFEPEVYGDVNQDGVLDIADAYFILEQTEYNADYDFDEDGILTSDDARIVYRETVDPRLLTESPEIDFESSDLPCIRIEKIASENPDEIQVLVYIDNDFGTESGFINIEYDSAVLEYAGFSSLIPESTAIMTVNDVTDESVNFSYAFLNHADNNNNLAIISFKIISATETKLNSYGHCRTISFTKQTLGEITVNTPPHEHNFIEKERVEATCSASGHIYYECECFESYVENLAKLEHTPGEWEVIFPAEVGVEGLRQQKCTVCGLPVNEEIIPALEEHEHVFLPGEPIEPSCTEEGGVEYLCECGSGYTEVIPAIGHIPGEWKVVTPADIGAEGLRQLKCTVCNYVIEEEIIPALKEPEPSDSVTLKISDVRAVAGDTVTVSFSLTNADNMNAISIGNLSYDKTLLTLQSKEWMLDGAALSSTDGDYSVIKFENNRDCNGVVYEVTFLVADIEGFAETEISCDITARYELANESESTIDVIVKNGVVKINDTVSLDYDNNGYVTTDDAVYVLKHIMMPDIFEVSGDVDFDGNGFETTDDAVYLLKHIMMPDIYPLK